VFKRAWVMVAAMGLMAGAMWAQDSPFLGDWKLNPSRSKLTDEMKVTSLGDNRYGFDFGGGTPLVAAADGTDYPGSYGITIGVIVSGPDKWTVVRKKDGKVLVTGVWTLSSDATTLTDHFTSVRPNGETHSRDYIYARHGSGTGFVGDWISTTEQMNSTYVMQVRTYEGDGLSFVTPGGGAKNVRFDGKDYPASGAVVEGVAASARRLDERKIEVTDKIQGKATGTEEIEVAPDAKTLTITSHLPGRSVDDVMVYEKQ
jgi:hypothetical protein